MAAGDIINVIITAPANTFVPAAGVEIIVLDNYVTGYTATHYGISDGVNVATNTVNSTTTGFSTLGNKLGITNTNYYYNNAVAGFPKGFSGIQIK